VIDPTEPPPGEPPAEALAEQLADVVVVDGPHAGEVWTYEADHGGYLPADPKRRQDDDTPIADIGALLLHVRAEVVRPIENKE
jgi:hypothetical protein